MVKSCRKDYPAGCGMAGNGSLSAVCRMLVIMAAFVVMVLSGGRQEAYAATVVAQGESFFDLTWTLDSAGTLTVSGGKGEEWDYIISEDEWDSYKDSIKNVVIEDGITGMMSSAFEGYTNLVSITIPSSVTELSAYTFQNCTSLKNVSMPGVTEIGAGCFAGCTSLASVTLPEGFTVIGGYAFEGCTALTDIAIPSTVTEIGNRAFYGCTSLKSVTIPGSVQTVGYAAFYGCSKLSSVTISSGVKTIGEWAFENCTSLTEIKIPASVTSLGESAFIDCTSLKNATIGKGVTSVSNYLFSGCTSLETVTLESGVQAIGDSVFEYCTSLTSVSIPSTVTSIGAYAFQGCSKLSSVTIPSGVTSIGKCAFYECSKLSSVTIPGSVTSLGDYAFYECTSLKKVTIEKGLTAIPDYAFYGCKKLSSVSLSSSITSIGEYAFYYCSALTKITLPGSLKTISKYAFADCSALEGITIPAKVSTIGSYAFAWCSSLCNVYIKDGVKKIDTAAFHNCSVLDVVRIPKSMKTISEGAFESCYSLDEVYYGGTKTNWSSISISSGNTYLTESVFTYSSTTSVVVADNEVTELQIVSTGVKVRWTKTYGAKGYYIYRKTGSGSYKKVGTVKSGSTLYYTDTTVSKDKTYSYKVKAYSGSAKSSYSTAKSIKFLKSTVKSVSNPTPETTFNLGHENYYGWYNWSQQVYSYLVAVDDGFMRVEYTGAKVVVEYYSSKWKLTSKKTVECELDLFGGFYAGEDGYYLIFGQTNPNESDSKEVIRVVKYSKSWKRQSNASVYGENTYIPFDAGSLSVAEYDGSLYILTCHEMYESSDGLHHQSNMSIVVKTSDMTVTGTGIADYVSHSFNQRVVVDDSGTLVTANHGDAYPRAMVVSTRNLSTDSYEAYEAQTFAIQGETGANYTGATLGGLEYSSSSYILAGSSVKQNSSWSSNSQYNIFITVTPRSDVSASGSTTKWITSYSEGKNINVSNPQLVKISSNKFLLMWTENSTTLKYVFLDGKGNKTTSIYSTTAAMSDCQPIYSGGYVYWYTAGDYEYYDYSAPTLYAINVKSSSKVYATTGSLSAPVLSSVSNASSGVKITWTGSFNAGGYIVYRKSGSGDYKKLKTITSNKTVSYVDKKASSGTSYTYKVVAYTKSGSTTKKSSYSNTKTISYLAAGKISSLTNKSTGIKVKWSKVSGASGYYVYRKTGSGSYKKIATIKKGSTTSYTDTAVKSKNGTTYIYKVVPYNSSTKGAATSKTTVRLTGTSLSSVSNSASKKITVKWSQKTKVTGYEIQYSTSSSFKSGNKSVTVSSASATSKVIGSLTKGKTYYVRIRTYKTVSDKKYYSAWSSKKSVKVSK
ncbi:MAG: leucine-rich repeat protein [Clostridiales bacterium]|nr:leucine-rich repeat protein [Clostridiales bacterium]